MMALMTKLECNGVPCHCQKYWTSRSPSHRWLARTLLSTSFHHLQYPTYLIKWARALPTIQCMFGGLMWEHYLSMKIDYLSSPTFGAWWHGDGEHGVAQHARPHRDGKDTKTPWLSTQKWFSVAKVFSSPFVALLEMMCGTMWVSYCQHTFRE